MNIKYLGCVVALLLAITDVAESQNAAKRPRIGFLSSSSDRSRIKAFQQALGELGYFEKKNITIEYRFAEGRPARLPALAAELVALEVDAIVTGGNEAIRAVKKATSTIPIVMIFSSYPVGSGFVANLARPGGNITGLTHISQQLVGKRLELLRDAVPRVSRVAILWSSSNPLPGAALREAEEVAGALGVALQKLEVKNRKDLERAFTVMRQEQANGLSVQPGSFVSAHRKQLVQFAATERLPAIYSSRRFVEAGGLMSYGAVRLNELHRAAIYVDKILKGAKPADLPVEQPTRFDLVINLKTAKQIGVTIPPTVLYRADKVIK